MTDWLTNWWGCMDELQHGGLKALATIVIFVAGVVVVFWVIEWGIWDSHTWRSIMRWGGKILSVIGYLFMGSLALFIVGCIIYGLYGAIRCAIGG